MTQPTGMVSFECVRNGRNKEPPIMPYIEESLLLEIETAETETDTDAATEMWDAIAGGAE